VDTILQSVVAFLTSREFAVNFFANLGGAMAGVLLAFWIERVRARRDARMLYGRILRTSRSELAYLKPMCEHARDALRAGQSAGTLDSLGVPATRALLVSPLVHDQAPYSLIMALTILCGCLGATENAFREARRLKPQDVVARELLSKTLGDQPDKANKIITIALEQIDSQLKLLGLEKTPDPVTHENGNEYQIRQLGHIYCGHLGCDAKGRWPTRTYLSHVQRELEAEAVAWLVAQRNGIMSRSKHYLASLLKDPRELEGISLYAVFEAANRVEARTVPRTP
jgi:hypothetical protein